MMSTPNGPPRHSWRRFDRTLRTWYRLLTDPLDFVGRRFAEYGDTYHVDEGGGSHLYVTCDADLVREVLVERPLDWRKAGGVNDRMVPALGQGLLTADGDTWKRARQKLQPGFRATAVRGFAEGMLARADRIDWHDGAERDVSADMMALTLDIACKSLFHHDAREDVVLVGKTMSALHDAMDDVPLPPWVPTPARRRGARAVAAIDTMVFRLIAERRERPSQPDLLSMLIEAGFDDRQIRDQVVTFFLAGHETTSHALSWCWWLLSSHPEALARLHAEVDAVGGPLTAETSLPWTDAVVAETLRLYPTAYAIPRVAARDTTLGTWDAPAGTQVVLWLWHLHRHPAHFVEPDTFRPQRFIDQPTPAAYHPFGAGTRMCIGAGFARLELRLVLAHLAQRWRLTPTDAAAAIPSPGVTLAPPPGRSMTVARRGPASH